mgnify:CR=1 FL=1
MRTTPRGIISRYFTKDGAQYAVCDKVKRLVSFSQLNLSDMLAIKRLDRSHIVFCRNVIIYFNDELKEQVISSFYDNLLPGGYLLIGHSESLHNISKAFQPQHHTGTIVYRRTS